MTDTSFVSERAPPSLSLSFLMNSGDSSKLRRELDSLRQANQKDLYDGGTSQPWTFILEYLQVLRGQDSAWSIITASGMASLIADGILLTMKIDVTVSIKSRPASSRLTLGLEGIAYSRTIEAPKSSSPLFLGTAKL